MHSRIPLYLAPLVLLLCIRVLPLQAGQVANESQLGALMTDLPFETDGQTIKFHIWLRPESPAFTDKDAVRVYCESNTGLSFEPPDFDLKLGRRVEILATRTSKEPLVEVVISSDSEKWRIIDQTVNFGSHPQLKQDLPKELVAGRAQPISLNFVDEQGKPMSFKAPTYLHLEGDQLAIKQAGKWVAAADIGLQTGANSSQLIDIRPDSYFGGSGALKATLRTSAQYVLTDLPAMSFTVVPRAYIGFMMAVIGAIFATVFELLLKLSKKDGGSAPTTKRFFLTAAIAVMTGILGVMFADKFGIKFDRTAASGFLVLGFLSAYVGADTLLNKLKIV